MNILKGIKENQQGFIQVTPFKVTLQNPHTLILYFNEAIIKNNEFNSNNINLAINKNGKKIIIKDVKSIETKAHLDHSLVNYVDYIGDIIKYKEAKIQFRRALTIEEIQDIMLEYEVEVNYHMFSFIPNYLK